MYDPFSQAYQSDPFSTYRKLQQADPVHWSESRGAWVLTRYVDVASVLCDKRFSSAAVLTQAPSSVAAPHKRQAAFGRLLMATLHYSDAPFHTRIRSLANAVFSRDVVECMRPRVQAALHALLLMIPAPHELTDVFRFSHLASRLIAAEVLGIPWSDIDVTSNWCESLRFCPIGRDPFPGEGGLHPDSEQATLCLQDYFKAHIAQQRRSRAVNEAIVFVTTNWSPCVFKCWQGLSRRCQTSFTTACTSSLHRKACATRGSKILPRLTPW